MEVDRRLVETSVAVDQDADIDAVPGLAVDRVLEEVPASEGFAAGRGVWETVEGYRERVVEEAASAALRMSRTWETMRKEMDVPWGQGACSQWVTAAGSLPVK